MGGCGEYWSSLPMADVMVVLRAAHMVSMSSNSVDRKVLLDEDMLERNPSTSAFFPQVNLPTWWPRVIWLMGCVKKNYVMIGLWSNGWKWPASYLESCVTCEYQV